MTNTAEITDAKNDIAQLAEIWANARANTAREKMAHNPNLRLIKNAEMHEENKKRDFDKALDFHFDDEHMTIK